MRPVAKLFAQRAGQCMKVVQPTLSCRRHELRLRVTPARFIGARAAELHQELLRGLRAVPLQEIAQLALRPIVPLASRAQPVHRAIGLFPDRFDRRGPQPDHGGDRRGAGRRRDPGGHRDHHRHARDQRGRGQDAAGQQAQSDRRRDTAHPTCFAGRAARSAALTVLQVPACPFQFGARTLDLLGCRFARGGKLLQPCRRLAGASGTLPRLPG